MIPLFCLLPFLAFTNLFLCLLDSQKNIDTEDICDISELIDCCCGEDIADLVGCLLVKNIPDLGGGQSLGQGGGQLLCHGGVDQGGSGEAIGQFEVERVDENCTSDAVSQ